MILGTPQRYENTSITVEVQGKTLKSCFTVNPDGTITCLMGKILYKIKVRGKAQYMEVKNLTGNAQISVYDDVDIKLLALVRIQTACQYPKYELIKIPINVKISPYSHTIDR